MPPNPELYYRLQVLHSEKFLTFDGERIYQCQELHDLKEQDQKWRFIVAGGDRYYIVSKREEGRLYLQKTEDQYLELHHLTGYGNQKWTLEPSDSNGYYFILNEGGYINVWGINRQDDGAEVATYRARRPNTHDNQKWRLVDPSPIDPSPIDLGPSLGITEMKRLLESFKNLVFQGPPGTSKTYNAKLLAASVVLGEDNKQKLHQIIWEEGNLEQNEFSRARFPGESQKGSWSIVQFHPAYNYEDFVRGIEVKGNGATVSYNAVRRIFDRMAHAAWKAAYRKDAKNCPKYVLIIDEINRAHLAAVLGELIYALEYRGSPVDSPYAVQEDGKESTQIIVPPNLYIIGTMNTADRSIGHIDYAVRRRFAFVPLLPEEQPIKSESGKKLFREIARLFKAENGGRAKTLSPEFHADDVQPGHTYFITRSSKESEVIDELVNKFAYQVYPLLREYFKDGILINAPKLFDGKLTLDTPVHPEEVRKIVESFLGQP